jgi:hypothetical protein
MKMRWIEVPTVWHGNDDYGGDELPNVFDGQRTKFPPHSFLAALSFFSFFSTSHSSFYAFTRILVDTANIIPGIRRSECAPQPHFHQFRLTNPAIVASPFVYPYLSSHYQ